MRFAMIGTSAIPLALCAFCGMLLAFYGRAGSSTARAAGSLNFHPGAYKLCRDDSAAQFSFAVGLDSALRTMNVDPGQRTLLKNGRAWFKMAYNNLAKAAAKQCVWYDGDGKVNVKEGTDAFFFRAPPDVVVMFVTTPAILTDSLITVIDVVEAGNDCRARWTGRRCKPTGTVGSKLVATTNHQALQNCAERLAKQYRDNLETNPTKRFECYCKLEQSGTTKGEVVAEDTAPNPSVLLLEGRHCEDFSIDERYNEVASAYLKDQ